MKPQKFKNSSTLLKSIEELLNQIKNTQITTDSCVKLISLYKEKTTPIGKEIKTNTFETLCFCRIFTDSIKGTKTDTSDIMNTFSLPPSELMEVSKALHSLEKKKLIILNPPSSGMIADFIIPDIILNKIFGEENQFSTIKEVVFSYGKLVNQLIKKPDLFNFYYKNIVKELRQAIKKTNEADALKNFENDTDLILFLLVAYRSLDGYNFEEIDINFMESMTESGDGEALRLFLNGEGNLYVNKIIELDKNTGDPKIFKCALGEFGVKIIFGEKMVIGIKNLNISYNTGTVTSPDKVKLTPLYFETEVHEKVQRIEQLLKEEEYRKFCVRMQQLGKKKGVSVLLHGKPGTGKTELVMQYCKHSGRKIFKVEVSTIKSKWIGDSEKNTKLIFNEYYNLCKNETLTPILLFNEADSLLSKRMGVSSSADQISNTIQNILLEELENFEGILFATTNLTSNVDQAFDRRFLFKLQFDSPGEKTRTIILKEKLHFLNETEITQIVSQYELTGGQIENISKRVEIEHLLTGQYPSFPQLLEFCINESNLRVGRENKIGY